MNRRLSMLESLTQSGQADAFAWYGLAMEYRREQRSSDALRTFEELRKLHPDYLPMYLMAGQVWLAEGQPEKAREWLLSGRDLAAQKGDEKTRGEISEALEECDSLHGTEPGSSSLPDPQR